MWIKKKLERGGTVSAWKWARPALVISMLFLAAACSRSPTDPNGHGAPAGLELLERGTNEVLAYVDVDHWHGSIQLEPGEEIAVDARFLDADGQQIPLGGEFTVATEIVEGPTEGVVELSDHGDHVDILGVGAGEVQVRFQLWHGGHSDWNSPPISIAVVAEPGDPSDVARVELVDRDSGEELAHTDGTGEGMQWDGELPHLHPGEELEVNVVFKDSQGRVITLGGDYVVQARLTEESPDGVVSIANHGDHVDIDGLDEGVVEIIFALWHDDHSEFDAPPIELEVEDP